MRTLASALLLGLWLNAPSARALEPEGPPVPLDSALSCGNREPAIAALPAGGFVAAWNDGVALSTRRLDALGKPAGPETGLTSGHPTGQKLVAFAGGGFAIVWFDTGLGKVLARFVEVPGAIATEVVVGSAGVIAGNGFGGLDATAGPGGTLAVTWTDGSAVYLRELRADGTALSEPWLVEAYFHLVGFHPALFTPVVLTGADDRLRVFWVLGSASGNVVRDGGVYGERLTRAIGGGGYFQQQIHTGAIGHDLAGAMASNGTYLLAWAGLIPGAGDPVPSPPHFDVEAQGFRADDTPFSQPVRVDEGPFLATAAVSVATRSAGGFVVAWQTDPDDGVDDFPLGLAREISVAGDPESAPVELAPSGPGSGPEGQAAPDLAISASGRLIAVWQQVLDPRILPFVCPGERIQARAFSSEGCGAPGTCVGDGRFAIRVDWSDPRRGIAGTGHGIALTGDTAAFWFFAPDNIEVIAKVIDGRPLNDRFWFFFAGLTDLGLHVEVVDRETGARRTYDSPAGTFASAADTAALPGGVGTAALGASAVTTTSASDLAADLSAAGPCSPPELPVVPRPGLCLAGQRFEVEARWRDGAGHEGAAQGVPIGDGSGGLWFFGPANVELVVKMVDGRALNGSFWVFYGALTDVEYDLVVRRVEDGAEWHHHNPAGHMGSGADVKPF
jgi:hypothetical protein